MVRCYMASPFFNKEQEFYVDEVMKQLEVICDMYVPKYHGMKVSEHFTDKSRLITYQNDLGGIDRCDFVFAILAYDDIWSMNENSERTDSELKIMEEKGITEEKIKDEKRVVRQIDSGSLLEIGYALGRGKPILAFIPPTTKTNLMLIPSFLGYTTKIDLCGELTREMLIEKKKFNKAKYINEEISVDKGVLIK